MFRFKTEQEAVDAANNTEFGLASYFYSRDMGRIFRVSEALEYGMDDYVEIKYLCIGDVLT